MDLNDDSRKIVSKKNLLSFPTDKSHSVRHICQDYETGRIYGCGNLGIFYCDSPAADPERMSFKWLDQLSGQDFYHIMFSTDGLLYASTMGNGLLVVDNKDNGNVQTRYTVDNGLLSDYVLESPQSDHGQHHCLAPGTFRLEYPSQQHQAFGNCRRDLVFRDKQGPAIF